MPSFRIVVDWDLCESNAVCQKLAPELFRVNEDDMLEVLLETPDESFRAKVEGAVRMCPRGALSLVEAK
jgi:ferredoxin